MVSPAGGDGHGIGLQSTVSTTSERAAMLILLAAVEEGLGALFFGLFPPEHVPVFLRSFGVPPDYEAIGVIAIGHPAPDTVLSSARRGRRPLDDVVHRGRW